MVALCVVLLGCEAGKTATTRARSFVPPPLRRAAPQPVPVEVNEALVTNLSVTPGSNFFVPTNGALPPRPGNPQYLLSRADRFFADGKRAVQEGRPKDARRDFDGAIDILMSEPLPEDAAERRRLQERLDDLVDAIYHYDLEQLGAGIPTVAALQAQQPVEKQILETSLPTNPGLRNQVREQIEMTMSELPLEETDAVLGYIDYFSSDRGRKILLSGFARAGRYRDMIHGVLSEEGMPAELIFVAQLESHFNPMAVSSAQAVGMWQFVRATGQEYRLKVTSQLDERRDPEKATRAAAKYLLDLYRRYGDWYLAMAAYNCGAGCVDRAILRTGYADFWELRRLRALPVATTNYVPVVLAMTIMFKNADAYGLAIEPDPMLEYESIELDADLNLALAAAAIDRPIGQVKQMNPALLQNVAPKDYVLRLPMGSLQQLQAALEAVPPAQRKSWRVHRVEESDTLASVAKKYGTTPAKVGAANNGALPEPGLFAAIPAVVVAAPAPKKATAKPAAKAGPKTATGKSSAKQSDPASSAKGKAPAKPGARAGGKAKASSTRAAGA
ncbi:MAG: transglycosylase SLT domain-containing protein [Acidobacteriota bacterium]